MAVDFLHIGPGRSGTTFIYEALKGNEQICLPGAKELNYFNINYEKGVDWYEKWFKHCSPDHVKGEISNLYIYDPKCAQRIHAYRNDMKIICVLRNPYNYVKSVYEYRRRAGELSAKLSFQEALASFPDMLDRCNYAELLRPYLELFGTENVFVRTFEDLVDTNGTYFKDLAAFLGIDEFEYVPDEKVNQVQEPRVSGLSKVTHTGSRALRKLGWLRLLQSIKNSRFINRMIYTKSSGQQVEYGFTKEQQERLNEYISATEQLLGWDLTSWRSTGAEA